MNRSRNQIAVGRHGRVRRRSPSSSLALIVFAILSARPLIAASWVSHNTTANMAVELVLFFDSFNDHSPPEAPDGWTALVGTWQTTSDNTTVYEQTDTTVARSGSVAGNAIWTDYVFEVRVKLVTAGLGSGRGAIMAFRYQNPSNYYFLVGLEDLDQLRLYRRTGGTDTLISSVDVPVNEDYWYGVRISVEGQIINVWVGGTQIFTNQDSGGTLSNGRIALGTRYYHGRFDDVEVFPIS